MLVMWGIRTIIFRLFESPRFLIAHGRDEQAVRVLQEVARINGTQCNLTVEQLRDAGRKAGAVAGPEFCESSLLDEKGANKVGIVRVAKRSLQETWIHVKALFTTPKVAWSTSLLIFLWGEVPRLFHLFH